MFTSLRNFKNAFNIETSAHKPFWLITIAIFLGLLVPFLVQEGMFVDGVTYAAISNNLAQGIGSFWAPTYNNPDVSFFDHPPLVMGIQSLFFKLFGDGFISERIHSLFMAILSGAGIICIWKQFKPLETSWIPILLWIIVPITFWSYQNNILENTLTVFCLFAIYFIIKSTQGNKFINLILASLLIIGAFLSKGVVGLFPIAIPVIYAITINNKRIIKSIIDSLILVILCALIMSCIFLIFPEAKENLSRYFDQQLIAALENKREITTNNRFFILWMLFTNLLPIIAIAAILQWRISKSKIKLSKEFLFLTMIGLSASIPIVISLKQREFYLVPSIPFFALAIAILISHYLIPKVNSLSKSAIKKINLLGVISLLTVFSVSALKWKDYSRKEVLLEDIYRISEEIPAGEKINIHSEYSSSYVLQAYLCRTNNMTLDFKSEGKYFLVDKGKTIPRNGYELKPTNFILFDLYQKISD